MRRTRLHALHHCSSSAVWTFYGPFGHCHFPKILSLLYFDVEATTKQRAHTYTTAWAHACVSCGTSF